jgi:Flp pilus assembly protein TadG
LTRQKPAGQAASEFALVAVAFFMLMFALIQMGLVICTYNTLCSATQDGARYAALHGPSRTPTAQQSDVTNIMLSRGATLNSSNLTVTLTWPADANLPSQNDAKVISSYNYRLQIPFITPVTLTFSSSAQMLVEQ